MAPTSDQHHSPKIGTKSSEKRFDSKNPDHLTEPIFRSYKFRNTKTCEELKYKDSDPWEVFRGDFEDWTEEIFDKADTKVSQQLRDYLRENGVWVMKKKKAKIIRELEEKVQNDNEYEWTQDEITYQMNSGVFDSHFNPKFRNSLGFKGQKVKTEQCKVPKSQVPTPQSQFSSASHPSQSQKSLDLPSKQSGDPSQTGFELSNLMKIHRGNIRHGGAENILDLLLQVYRDLCENFGTQECNYKETFCAIPKRKVRDYHCTKIDDRGPESESIFTYSKEHPEAEEQRPQMPSRWNTM